MKSMKNWYRIEPAHDIAVSGGSSLKFFGGMAPWQAL